MIKRVTYSALLTTVPVPSQPELAAVGKLNSLTAILSLYILGMMLVFY